MVLAEGRQVYYGKPSNAASFLTYHGLPNPHNFPIAENLLEVAANKSLLDKLLESVNTKPPFGQAAGMPPPDDGSQALDASADDLSKYTQNGGTLRLLPHKADTQASPPITPGRGDNNAPETPPMQ